MHKLGYAALLAALIAIVGCTAGPSVPTSPAPSLPGAPESPGPSVTPDPSPTPTPPASPRPTPTPPATPRPTPEPTPTPTPQPTFTIDEQFLLAGILRGAIDCKPVRSGLPSGATGGIECRSDNKAVARIGFYVFDGSAEMVEAYLARMKAEGIELDSGSDCRQREGEGAYIPGEFEWMNPYRAGCFVNAEGYANYRFTTGDRVYVGILGRTADMGVLEDFAWLGNRDTPGNPTLWGDPGW